MGIFKRMKTIAKADMNGWLDNLEDPISMLNEYSREMDQEIGKAQSSLSRQLLAENKQATLILDTKALVEKRMRQAKLAMDRGEETMAKLAVQEKLTHEKQLALYEEQYETIKNQTEALKEKLVELQQAYQQLEHKKILLASRANVAQSMKQIQKATSSFQTDNILKGVARVEDHILWMEAEVQVGNQYFSPLVKYDSTLVDDEEVNNELAKLKSEKELLV